MPEKQDNTLRIDDAHIRYRNFSGNKTQFNPQGSRNFCVDLDDDTAALLEADGWNVKYTNPREEGDTPIPFIKVNVKYEIKPPRVVLVKSNGQTNLTEDMVGILDFADLRKVDMIIRPFTYDNNGKSGISGYLKTMYATIEEDELERKYGSTEVYETAETDG